jgi:hypothetical protein
MRIVIRRDRSSRRRLSSAAALGLALFAAKLAAADTHALPCRPTVACTADIVPPGVVELETGYAARLSTGSWQHGIPFLLKLTIIDQLQLQMSGNGNFIDSNRWLDNIVTGLKLHLQDQEGGAPSLSFSVALSIPTAPAPGYVRAWDFFSTIYLSRDFGWLHADLNVGVNAWSLESSPRFQPWAALALSTELRHHLTPMVELHVLGDAAPIAPLDSGVLMALAWAARTWLVLDGGLDVSFVPSTRTVTLFAGLTIAPADLWDTPSERRRRAAASAH